MYQTSYGVRCCNGKQDTCQERRSDGIEAMCVSLHVHAGSPPVLLLTANAYGWTGRGSSQLQQGILRQCYSGSLPSCSMLVLRKLGSWRLLGVGRL